MKYYTLIDLRDAKGVIDCINSWHGGFRTIAKWEDGDDYTATVYIDYSQPIYTQEYIDWANDVINWFKALFKVARLFHRNWLKDWQLSLKAVWQCVKSFRYLKQLFKLLREMRQRASAKVVSTIRKYRYEKVSKRDAELLSCRGRTGKSNLRIKRAQDAHFKQLNVKL